MRNDAAPNGAMARSAAAYRAWLAARPIHGALTAAVAALLARGTLHPFDAEWIARLKPSMQLAAARKVTKDEPITFSETRYERSVISHGHPGSRNAF